MITKRNLETYKQYKVAFQMWKPDLGPLENVGRLLDLGAMTLGGVWGMVAVGLAHMLDLSMQTLGHYFDNLFGFGPGTDLSKESKEEALKKVEKEVQSAALLHAKTASDNSILITKNAVFVKEAGLFGLLSKLFSKKPAPVSQNKNWNWDKSFDANKERLKIQKSYNDRKYKTMHDMHRREEEFARERRMIEGNTAMSLADRDRHLKDIEQRRNNTKSVFEQELDALNKTEQDEIKSISNGNPFSFVNKMLYGPQATSQGLPFDMFASMKGVVSAIWDLALMAPMAGMGYVGFEFADQMRENFKDYSVSDIVGKGIGLLGDAGSAAKDFAKSTYDTLGTVDEKVETMVDEKVSDVKKGLESKPTEDKLDISAPKNKSKSRSINF